MHAQTGRHGFQNVNLSNPSIVIRYSPSVTIVVIHTDISSIIGQGENSLHGDGREVIKEEARLVLDGWLENRTLLRCEGRIGPSVFQLRCRVRGITWPGDISLISEDGESLFSFGVASECKVLYAEPRSSPEAAELITCVLSFIFPRHGKYFRDGDDFIAISELKVF
jgi:hypothetical protein